MCIGVTEDRINRNLCLTSKDHKGCRQGMWQARQETPGGQGTVVRPGDVVALGGPALGGCPGSRLWCRRESVPCWGTRVLKREEGRGASLELLVRRFCIGCLVFLSTLSSSVSNPAWTEEQHVAILFDTS